MIRSGRKHKLKVAQWAGFPPSKYVYFQCERCVANLHIERPVMEAILTQGDDRFSVVPTNVLGECHG